MKFLKRKLRRRFGPIVVVLMSSDKALDDEFCTAADHISGSGSNVSDHIKLELYALYKQATIGPCTVARPKFFDFSGKAKWDAWQSKGDMSLDEAKLEYIGLARRIFQGDQRLSDEDTANDSNRPGSDVLAPSVSRMSFQPEECDVFSLWDLACDNEIEKIQKLLDTGVVLIDARDENGCSALHLACDRGHAQLTRLLLDVYKANVNLQDAMGCTPLHYAVCCDRPEIARILMNYGASATIKDNEGYLPISRASPEVAAIVNHSSS